MERAGRRATYDDLLKVPDHLVAEIIDGELVTSPRPSSPHAYATTMLSGDITAAFGQPPGSGAPNGWWILFEPELHLRDDVIVPDLAGWRRSGMPVLPDVAAFTQAPDWVCEVVSPSTGALDRGRKMHVYARALVAHRWLVDPIARTLETYRLENEHWVVASTHGGDDAARAEPFAAVALATSRWWLKPA